MSFCIETRGVLAAPNTAASGRTTRLGGGKSPALVLWSGDDVFGREGRGRQSVAVIETDYRRVCPPVPDVLRLRNPCAADYDGLAVDARAGVHKATVVSGNLKPLENASPGYQTTSRVIEPHPHTFTLGSCLPELRARELHVFAIGQGPRSQGQPHPDCLFVGGMNVVRVADINGHDHSRISHR